ncbi:hypothetical protein HO173_003265 [Letharia columbiana]|uniref:Uncharacterized protein n=1 Tax=Letharia columbiana TaxID=112416 RepID=A0A8H6G1F3_9LECA|nr:uncharacterized protein HO173_003265 [Letharia columbiana]KAF6238758.1 hypothetical protein HO173_003265 [Letharia columbiana]
MPFPPLFDAYKDRIQQHILNGLAVASVVSVEGVWKSTIYRIIDNLLGRQFAIFPAAWIGLRAFIESKRWAYQDEMQYDLI